ncbi:MAG: hypothetical protein RR022_06530 [Angelakisella sp.]
MSLEQTPSEAIRLSPQVRRLRHFFRRLWYYPDSFKLFTPGMAAGFLLTAVSGGLTAVAWAMARLLPNREAIALLMRQLPKNWIDYLKSLPALLSQLMTLLQNSPASTQLATGAIVSQEAYFWVFLFGFITLFSLLVTLLAFVRRW